VALAPGEAKEFTFEISKLCSFSRPGDYKIVVYKSVHWPGRERGTFMAASNPLLVTVSSQQD
jgi:hypothetical protein